MKYPIRTHGLLYTIISFLTTSVTQVILPVTFYKPFLAIVPYPLQNEYQHCAKMLRMLSQNLENFKILCTTLTGDEEVDSGSWWLIIWVGSKGQWAW